MATIKMVKDMEELILSAPSLPLRVYAGACCCLAHCLRRWQDLLWSQQLYLTADALWWGFSWKMKKKRVHTHWAALRAGFTGSDWAVSWVDALTEAGLPGDDFVLKAVSKDANRFIERIACFNDAISMMRTLVIIAGMDA